MSSFPLSDELLTAAGPDARFTAGEGLEELLETLVSNARAAWPDVELETSRFVRQLARHLPEDRERLERLHAADLFLACACLHGNTVALEHFHRLFLSRVRDYVSKLESSPSFADEVRQLLSERLLVWAGGEPKIASYSGAGALEGWVRVAAIRTGQNLLRGPTSKRSAANEALALHDRAPSPELEYLRTRYAGEFSEALRESLSEQPAKQKNLLNLYFVDGLPSAAIGKLYGVHGATVRRWIEQARQTLLDATRLRLRQRLKIDVSELESLMILVQSQLDITLTRCLKTDCDPTEG